MKAAELRAKSKDELDSMLLDLKKEQLNLRFQRTTGELENTARVRTVRKTVARIKTLLADPANLNQAAPVKKKVAKKKVAPAKKTVAKKTPAKKKAAAKEEK
jgi:large subunit ribosomal protein L29